MPTLDPCHRTSADMATRSSQREPKPHMATVSGVPFKTEFWALLG